jgi:hypothetical protein
MDPLIGYSLCLLALMPALSLEVFFGLLGRTSHQHEALAIVRTILQLLTSVSSPAKIGLATGVLLLAYAAESGSARRILTLVVVSAAGFSSTLQLLSLGHGEGIGAAALVLCSSLASALSASDDTRALAVAPEC